MISWEVVAAGWEPAVGCEAAREAPSRAASPVEDPDQPRRGEARRGEARLIEQERAVS